MTCKTPKSVKPYNIIYRDIGDMHVYEVRKHDKLETALSEEAAMAIYEAVAARLDRKELYRTKKLPAFLKRVKSRKKTLKVSPPRNLPEDEEFGNSYHDPQQYCGGY